MFLDSSACDNGVILMFNAWDSKIAIAYRWVRVPMNTVPVLIYSVNKTCFIMKGSMAHSRVVCGCGRSGRHEKRVTGAQAGHHGEEHATVEAHDQQHEQEAQGDGTRVYQVDDGALHDGRVPGWSTALLIPEQRVLRRRGVAQWPPA